MSIPWSLLACLGVTLVFVAGIVWLRDSIVQLISGSANPRFAMFILIVAGVGQILAIFHAVRLSQESHVVERLRRAMDDKLSSPRDIQRSALGQSLFQAGASETLVRLFGPLRAERAQGGDDRAALQARFHGYQAHASRRLLVPGHIANTLIGLGLFGTFLGLIVTLKDVASLISVIAASGQGDSAETMARFFTEMSGPLAGMGEAFVASLFGLGSSMVNGLQMLALRRLQAGAVTETETTYFAIADALADGVVPADLTQPGSGHAVDERLIRLQVEAITGLRSDLTKQTEAILLASSKMRLASDAMQAMSALAEKRLASDEARVHIEKMTSLVAQRLEVVARKFDDLQVAQNMFASSAQAGAGALVDMTLQVRNIADHAGTSLREMAALRGAVMEVSGQSREQLAKVHSELRAVVQRDLAAVVAAVAEGTRELRQHGSQFTQLGGQAMETNLNLQTLDEGLREIADRVQPQLLEMVARLDAASQAESLTTKHELAHLNRKFDELSEDLIRRAQLPRDQ